MGVPAVWLVDPNLRSITIYTDQSTRVQSAGTLTVPHTLVKLEIAQIFSVLDDYDTPTP